MIDRKKAAAALCALALAGCTKTLDNDKMQAFVKDTIKSQIGANVKSVSCPKDRVQTAGDTFECTAEIDHGTATVTITQTDANGNVSLDTKKQAILKVAELEKMIAAAVKANGVDMAVDCGPKFRPSVPNESFECTGKIAGGYEARYKVTVKDAQGNIAYETIQSATATGAAPPAAAPEEAQE